MNNGIEQRDKEIVLNMLAQNISLEEIAKLTGIDISKIKQIACNA